MCEDREKFLNAVKMRMASMLDADTANDVLNVIAYELRDYELTKTTTELVPYDDDNNKVIKSYLACLLVEGKSKGTVIQYKSSLKRLFEFLGNKRYDEVRTFDIRAWLASLKVNGCRSVSIRNQKNNITPFFAWLQYDGLIDKNPCDPIKPIKVPDEEKTAFSSEEIDTIRSNCVKPVERAVVETLLSSGLRVAELCDLKMDDIDFNTLTVKVRCGKGGKDRTTFITPVAKKYLIKYINGNKHKSEYVFTSRLGGKYYTGGIRCITTNLSDRCGINVHPHRFRRTLATDLARKGMPIQEIQKMLGHTSIETTRKYIETRTEKVENSYRQYVA